MTSPRHAERFTDLMSVHGPAVLGYLTRRTDPPQDAADLMAETFMVAWRRLDAAPAEPDQARAWLIGVARRQLANHRRGRLRRAQLADRLRQHLLVNAPRADAGPHRDVHAALAALKDEDRELLTLVTWEDLTPAQAATVLGLSSAATRKRLERARGRLRAELERMDTAGHPGRELPSTPPSTPPGRVASARV